MLFWKKVIICLNLWRIFLLDKKFQVYSFLSFSTLVSFQRFLAHQFHVTSLWSLLSLLHCTHWEVFLWYLSKFFSFLLLAIWLWYALVWLFMFFAFMHLYLLLNYESFQPVFLQIFFLNPSFLPSIGLYVTMLDCDLGHWNFLIVFQPFSSVCIILGNFYCYIFKFTNFFFFVVSSLLMIPRWHVHSVRIFFIFRTII